jgi:hypothetical protein
LYAMPTQWFFFVFLFFAPICIQFCDVPTSLEQGSSIRWFSWIWFSLKIFKRPSTVLITYRNGMWSLVTFCF